MKLLIGTRNAKKLAELKTLLAGLPLELVDLDGAGCTIDVEEDGATLEANAVKKATVYSQATGLLTMADDSGLEVDALGGQPGVRSARYAGPLQDDRANIAKLLDALRGTPATQRTARFRTVVALADGPETVFTTSGTVEGVILEEPRGHNGFGYDPVFYHPPSGCAFAELAPERKNAVSHRSQALEAFGNELRRCLA